MILIQQPYKRRFIDWGDVNIPKYSTEYYQLLWRDGYNNGLNQPKDKRKKFQFHKKIAKRFDKKYGYSFYDDDKKDLIYRRKNQDRIERNVNRYLAIKERDRAARDSDILFVVNEKKKRENESFKKLYDYELKRHNESFNKLYNYQQKRFR